MKRFSFVYFFLFSLCYLITSCSNNSSLLSDDLFFKNEDDVSSIIGSESSEIDIPLDVIILAGQSNATGISNTEELKDYISSDLYELFSNGCDNIFIIGHTDWSSIDQGSNEISLQKVKFGLGAYSYHFGLEIGISSILKDNGKKTLIIKYTSPGNFIDFFLNGDSISYHFEKFINYSLNKLKNLGFTPSIKAMCWMQGENDSMLYNYAVKYEEKENLLISAVRKKYGENIIFVDARVTDWNLVQINNFQSIVNEAKEKISSSGSRNYLIDSTGLNKSQKDACHYDARSEFELGARMGKIIQKVIE